MPNKNQPLEWCIVRLGQDHNWWVDEISDTVHWDVDNLSILDPRQVDHLMELIEPLREYNFKPDILERALIPFRIDKDLGGGRIRLVRVKESLTASDEPLFALPDVIDEENGPYADFLDHILRLRVKLLNDQKHFEEKLTVDDVEDELREEQNNLFMEGKSVHVFNELLAVLDYMPEGWEEDEEKDVKKPEAALEDDDIYEVDEEDEERLNNDKNLRWDEDDEDADLKENAEKDEDDEESEISEEEEEDTKPRSSRKTRKTTTARNESKPNSRTRKRS